MKNVLLFLFAFACTAMAEDTLFSGHVFHSGGFGGPSLNITELGPNNDLGLLVGGKGGWIINHQYILGGGGYGLANNIDVNWMETTYPSRMEMGYGGVYLGYIRNSDAVIHTLVDVLIGWGAVGISEDSKNNRFDNEDYWYDEDAFFVVEPGINLELNVFHWLRIGGGVSYRLVQGVDFYGMTDENMSGLSARIQFKFGSF